MFYILKNKTTKLGETLSGCIFLSLKELKQFKPNAKRTDYIKAKVIK